MKVSGLITAPLFSRCWRASSPNRFRTEGNLNSVNSRHGFSSVRFRVRWWIFSWDPEIRNPHTIEANNYLPRLLYQCIDARDSIWWDGLALIMVQRNFPVTLRLWDNFCITIPYSPPIPRSLRQNYHLFSPRQVSLLFSVIANVLQRHIVAHEFKNANRGCQLLKNNARS